MAINDSTGAFDLTQLPSVEWELLDPTAPERATLNELLDRLTQQVQQGNSYPIELFRPLYQAIGARLAANEAARTARLDATKRSAP